MQHMAYVFITKILRVCYISKSLVEHFGKHFLYSFTTYRVGAYNILDGLMRHHRFVPQKKFIHGVLVSLDSWRHWSWIWIIGASLAVDSVVPYPFSSVHHRPGLNWLVSQISRSPRPWPRHGMSRGADLGGAGLIVDEDPSEKIYLRLLRPPHASAASRPPKSLDMGWEKGVSTRGNRGRLPREERPRRQLGLAGEPSHRLICLAATPSSGVGDSPCESRRTACGWTGPKMLRY
jgi:hypothetical protein